MWFKKIYRKATILQMLINYLYRFPISKHKQIKRFGGYIEYWKMLRFQNTMIEASRNLNPIQSYCNEFTVYFLTGQKYIHQTLFCILSFTRFSDRHYKFVLIDDGTFDQSLIEKVNEVLPGSKIILKDEIMKNLESSLPESNFPYLRNKRKVYPHIRKLTDIHTIKENPFKLVLDSDMLFWGQPTEIEQWLDNPIGSLHMIDCIESYGYSRSLMQNLCGHKIPRSINVGAIGLNSVKINWEEVEKWAKTLEEQEGTSYFLEQALSAMIIASHDRVAVDSKKYIVNPSSDQVQNAEGILHHYVDQSKKYYFLSAWKKILKTQ